MDSSIGGERSDQEKQKKGYEFNPYSAPLDFFSSEIILIIRSALHPKNRTRVMQIRHKKLTNHGVWQKWPLALSISMRHPNPAHQPHPHTMG